MTIAQRNPEPYQGIPAFAHLADRIAERSACVAVLGLGYVGVPLATAIVGAGFSVIGFDPKACKVRDLNAGRSFMKHIPSAEIGRMVGSGRFEATSDETMLATADIFVICVPTPLNAQRDPDLTYVRRSGEMIARHMRPGSLVILESTTYPGTTDDVLRPILEAGGLACGVDFALAFSPEREDPGNSASRIEAVPKVVGGVGAEALRLAGAFYSTFVETTVAVSSAGTAEAVKLTENIFRSVNIALVNEVKVIYEAMGVDIWEVIEAARTKPFGYMPFYPGPGLGGHCIPIDPFYLSWKAKEHGLSARFIELSGEINRAMPTRVIGRTGRALNDRLGKSISRSRILVIGVAYKRNVDDVRESPALAIMQGLRERGAEIAFHDPFVSRIDVDHDADARPMVGLTAEACLAERWDAAIIIADHDGVDYAALTGAAAIVVDTRNVMARGSIDHPCVVKA